MTSAAEDGWPAYLSTFHAERAGITEDVLQHARDTSGRTPYAWTAAQVRGAGAGLLVLDLACGSAPMAEHLAAARYVGADLSAAELRRARSRRASVVRADAGRLPFADRSVDAVLVSMALMLVPLTRSLGEVQRVLRPGGLLVATVPCNRPLPLRDWLRYARLCAALRHRGLAYPNDALLRDAGPLLAASGLVLLRDATVPFACRLEDDDVADQLLASLYLPDVDPARMAAGRRVVRRWVGTSLVTPLRILVATSRSPTGGGLRQGGGRGSDSAPAPPSDP